MTLAAIIGRMTFLGTFGQRRLVAPGLVLSLLALVLLLVGALASPAAADPFADELKKLGTGGFPERIAASEELGAIGDPRAVPVLRALNDSNLYVRASDGKVVIVKEEGATATAIDPETGAAIGPLDRQAFEAIRVNNRLRVAIRGALGRLVLFSPDRAERLEAALGLFRTRSTENLPLLEKAIAAEKDSGVLAQLKISLAATQLLTPEPQTHLAAIAELTSSSDVAVRAILVELSLGKATSAEVRDAATKAIEAIDRRVEMVRIAQTLFQGLSLGSVLLLAAMGLAITFGVMGVINMAHGEMVMIGAYTTFVVQQVLHSVAPGLFDYSLLFAVPAAFLVAGTFGVGLERGLIRFLYGRPLETLLMTWGLSMILQQTVRSLFGPTNREVSSPSWMTGAIELTGGITITQNRIWIILFSLAVLGLIVAITRFTTFGLQMRAVTQNRAMASAMGIRTNWVDALTFGLGSGIAGIGGVALSQIDNVSPNLGQSYIIDSFLVVVFGGVGNLFGTLVGAMTLGVINKALEPYAGAVLGKIFVLVGIIIFIQRRPRGLFALKGRAVEN